MIDAIQHRTPQQQETPDRFREGNKGAAAGPGLARSNGEIEHLT
ncbi:MAG: hypothetical protein OXG49_18120 [Chloroflexi bacterium]|nr:hypothetical protein [Chloroflexota bacterium]